MFGATLGMRLRGAYLTFHRRANQHYSKYGVTADQFVVLTVLAEAEGLTQRELVDRVFSDPNTIAAMLSRLEDRKLVRREPHAVDARARCVFLTNEGRRLQQRLWDESDDRRADLDKLFTREERAVLSKMLERIPKQMAARSRTSATAAE